MIRKFYPVVHFQDIESCLENIAIAKSNNADGVFLISHGGQPTMYQFMVAINQAVAEYKDEDFKIGVNWLGLSNRDAFEMSKISNLSMLWSDNAGTDYTPMADLLSNSDRLSYELTYFGGVHFKYQPKSEYSIEESIRRAKPWVDVPTLSGPATGTPADVHFIRRAHAAADGKPLAIASGISIDNVETFLPYIDYYLVSSSIIKKGSETESFDERKLKQLAQLVHKE